MRYAVVAGMLAGYLGLAYGIGTLLKRAASRLKVRRHRPEVEERLLRVLNAECWPGTNNGRSAVRPAPTRDLE